MAGPVGQPQPFGQHAERAVRHLVAHQPAGERAGVDDAVGEPRPARACERGVQEAHVEADVVAHDDGVARELEERWQHRVDGRRGHDHGLGDPGEHGDLGRDLHARVHERLEGAQALAAAQLDRAHLGDRAGGGRPARRLQVDDAERDVAERRTQVVERALHARRGYRTGVRPATTGSASASANR